MKVTNETSYCSTIGTTEPLINEWPNHPHCVRIPSIITWICVRLFQAHEVFTGQTVTGLDTSTEFTVSINPSGVVMWYIYPKPSKHTDTHHHQHYKASRFSFNKAKPGHHVVLWTCCEEENCQTAILENNFKCSEVLKISPCSICLHFKTLH